MGTNASDLDATVGIITRTKDRPVLLKRALESVVNQSYEDWHLVIVNDGGDPVVVEVRLRKEPQVISPDFLGPCPARNRGEYARLPLRGLHDLEVAEEKRDGDDNDCSDFACF